MIAQLVCCWQLAAAGCWVLGELGRCWCWAMGPGGWGLGAGWVVGGRGQEQEQASSPFRPNKPIVDQNYAWYSGLSSRFAFACATPCT